MIFISVHWPQELSGHPTSDFFENLKSVVITFVHLQKLHLGKKYPNGKQNFDGFCLIVPKVLGLGTMLIPHFKALIFSSLELQEQHCKYLQWNSSGTTLEKLYFFGKYSRSTVILLTTFTCTN